MHRGGRILEFDVAGDAQRGGPDGAFGGVDGGEHGHLHQQRREQWIVDHLHLVRLDELAVACDADRHRNRGGALAEFAGDGGIAVVTDGAHPFAGHGELEGGVGVGHEGDDLGAREGQGGGAHVEEAVAESIDMVAIDIGDGAIGAHVVIAGEELDTDHGSGLEVGGIAHGGIQFAGGTDRLPWLQPERAELRREGLQGGAGESAEGKRGGDIGHLCAAGHGERGLGKCAEELVGGEGDRRSWSGDGCTNGDGPDHVFDGADAGDGIFGEGEPQGHRTDEFSIYIYWAAAHALHDAGLFQRSAGKSREDDGLMGPHVIEYAEDFDLEFLDTVPGEDGASDAVHAGTDVL